MKKITVFLIVFLFLFVFVTQSLAKDEEKEDKGPLTKITFIHYKKGFVKPPAAGKPDKNQNSCYSFLANGAKWRNFEPYYINTINPDGLSSNFIEEAINLGVTEWEKYGGDIFGDAIINNDASYNNGNYDDVNTASFGAYSDLNVIAVTTVWGYWSGSPKTREIVEWDMLFNTSSTWDWGDGEKNSALMDLQNIATHELGHAVGMADLYQTGCGLESMYGYSREGEIIKRDLNSGDILGIGILY